MATSADRHEARYRRRKARREQKAREAGGMSFDEAMSLANLLQAGKECCNGSRWKTSVINFETDLVLECVKIHDELVSDKRRFKGFKSFDTLEHGKLRHIDAVDIRERCLQKCICKNVLVPAFSRGFVYDNAASLKNKGMDFALERLAQHLRRHYRKYGTEGGILLFDFTGYFASLPHAIIKRRGRSRIKDDRLYKLFCDLVDEFLQMGTAEPEAQVPHGVGLGSEVSQIIALDFASPIDHYVKDVCGIAGYGRYMDDGYVICESLPKLEEIRDALCGLAQSLGVRISDKKTRIIPFRHHSFTFLKMRVTLRESGKVTVKLSRKSIKAMRRKLKIFRKWLDSGRMDAASVFQSYQSWRAHAKRCNSYDTLCAMDEAFVALFKTELARSRGPFPCTLKAVKTADGWTYYPRTKENKCNTSPTASTSGSPSAGKY